MSERVRNYLRVVKGGVVVSVVGLEGGEILGRLRHHGSALSDCVFLQAEVLLNLC